MPSAIRMSTEQANKSNKYNCTNRHTNTEKLALESQPTTPPTPKINIIKYIRKHEQKNKNKEVPKDIIMRISMRGESLLLWGHATGESLVENAGGCPSDA